MHNARWIYYYSREWSGPPARDEDPGIIRMSNRTTLTIPFSHQDSQFSAVLVLQYRVTLRILIARLTLGEASALQSRIYDGSTFHVHQYPGRGNRRQRVHRETKGMQGGVQHELRELGGDPELSSLGIA